MKQFLAFLLSFFVFFAVASAKDATYVTLNEETGISNTEINISSIEAQPVTLAAPDSPWVVVQAVDLPYTYTILEGTTRTGNPKYWIDFPDIGSITVSATNVAKYRSKQVVLELVKWQNKDTQAFRYSIRQKKGAKKKVPDIDLSKLIE